MHNHEFTRECHAQIIREDITRLFVWLICAGISGAFWFTLARWLLPGFARTADYWLHAMGF